jgi:alpha-tubulin suppressor-like RCC1 family protein
MHSCGIQLDGTAMCWGTNALGQLGNGTFNPDAIDPTPVSGNHHYRAIAAGMLHTCALDEAGQAYCWGIGTSLGDSVGVESNVPVAVVGGLAFVSLAAGASHTCARTGSNVAYCWGSNASGWIGDGTTTTREYPVAVLGGLSFVSLAAGAWQTCGGMGSWATETRTPPPRLCRSRAA